MFFCSDCWGWAAVGLVVPMLSPGQQMERMPSLSSWRFGHPSIRCTSDRPTPLSFVWHVLLIGVAFESSPNRPRKYTKLWSQILCSCHRVPDCSLQWPGHLQSYEECWMGLQPFATCCPFAKSWCHVGSGSIDEPPSMFIDFTSATGAVGPRLISKGGKMVPCQRLQGLRSVNFNQRVRWFTKILKECLRHCGMVVLDHVVIWLLCILGAWPYLGQAGESKQLMIGCFPCLLNVSEDRPNHLKAYLFHRETSCSLNCFSPLVHSLRLNGLLPKTVAAWNGKWKVVVSNMWRFPTRLACLGQVFFIPGLFPPSTARCSG